MQASTVDLVADTARAATARRTMAWAAGGLAAAATVAGGWLAPPDELQGDAQRLMYLHVPAAWVAYVAFAVVLAASGAYLMGGDLRWDRFARAAAELGVVLTAAAIATGSLWGHLVGLGPPPGQHGPAAARLRRVPGGAPDAGRADGGARRG